MASPATHPQSPDPTPVSIMIMDSEEKTADSDNIKEKPPLLTNEKSVSPNSSQDAALLVHPNDTTVPLRPFGSGGDHTVYPPNFFAPQAQAFYYGGYDNAVHEWDEYPPFYNAEGLEVGSAGVYNDNSSLVFHTGYGYSPQMPYGPYSPVTTPLPAVGGDTQLYSPQQFSFSGPPYYQQLVPPSGPYITSPTQVSQPELTTSINLDQRNENMLFGPSPGYPHQVGSFGRGNFPGNPGTIGFHDLQQGFDGLRSGGIWSDWSKPSDRQRPFTPLSPVVSPQPMGRLGSFGQNLGMTSHQQRSTYGFGSSSNSYSRGYRQSSFNQGSSFGGASPLSSLGMSGRGWLSLDSSRRPGRGTGSLCSCNATLDILSEQNRGPRASKPKSQITSERSSSVDGNNHDTSTFKIRDESFNRPDFVTEYKDAKFFVIKSYSEDNIHKSIKYGVWASTPNGNKKLDAAYLEAKGKEGTCPVFLFFSVNASAQFCGVAEMVGRVDFDKSVDYWQHDKWNGQFPVKWHIVKDVPNNQFRHIILENNDNKPVTNSRDTQEVKLEQGVEMLSIFQTYETDTSILDDFDFYEDRQKAMQEQKARQQQANRISVGENEHQSAVALSNDFIKHMSKSFAQVVRLEEGTFSDRPSSASEGTRVKLNDPITATVSSVPTI